MKNNKLKSMFTQRKYRYGTMATLLTVGVIILVILVNITAGSMENKWGLAIDASVLKVSELNEQTLDILADLDEDVYVYTVYQSTTATEMRIQLEEMLRSYDAASDHFHWSNLDPVTDPLKVKKLAGGESVTEGALLVTNADESRVKVLDVSDYYTNEYYALTGSTYTIFSAEIRLTSSLLYVTGNSNTNVYFLAGHQEIDPDMYYTSFVAQMENNNYDVSKLDLSAADAAIEKGDVLIITDPSVDLTDEEYAILRAWLDDGGRMLVCIHYTIDLTKLPNFVKLLDYYQLAFDTGYIQESENSSNNWRSSVYYLMPNLDAEHEITADLTRYQILPYARPIQEVQMNESNTVYTKLMTTSPSALTVQNDGSAAIGTRTVGMSLETIADDPADVTRIILVGSSPMLSDQYASTTYNLDFATRAVRWLVNDDSMSISIMPDLVDTESLVIQSGTDFWTLTALVVVIIPLIAAVAGVVVWIRRRRL